VAQQVAPGNLTQEGTEAALTTLLAGVPLAGAKVHLYQSTFAPTLRSVAADFIAAEANYTGYAPVALTYSGVGLDSAGNPTVLTNRAYFQATDAVTPNTIGGCWVQSDTVGPPATHTSVEWYPFPSQVPMTTALAFLGLVLGIQIPGGPGFAIADN
jgi:hypothetical protein